MANGSPYSVQVQACNGDLCGPKATIDRVVPAGNVQPTLATFDGTSATAAAAAGVVPPVGSTAGPAGWQVLTKTSSTGFRIPTKKPVARRT